MTMALIQIPLVAIALAYRASSFTPTTSPRNNIRSISNTVVGGGVSSKSSLFSFIKGEAIGAEPFDENEGGVGLAKRCAIKIIGVSKKGSGSEPQEIVRYEKMQEVDKSVLDESGSQLLCSGTGRETYVDPGSSNRFEDKTIVLAPIEAAKAALSSMASAVTIGEDAKSVVMNFLGGEELIIGEVMAACDVLVDGLDFPAKTKVKFNSLSFADIPADVCSVTVVASGDKAGGELYAHDGKWFTVTEGDITTATK